MLVSLKCRFSFVHTLLLSWPKLWFRKLIGWFDLHCCLNFRCKRSGPCLPQPCEFGSNHTRETVDIAEAAISFSSYGYVFLFDASKRIWRNDPKFWKSLLTAYDLDLDHYRNNRNTSRNQIQTSNFTWTLMITTHFIFSNIFARIRCMIKWEKGKDGGVSSFFLSHFFGICCYWFMDETDQDLLKTKNTFFPHGCCCPQVSEFSFWNQSFKINLTKLPAM